MNTRRNELLRVLTMVLAILGIIENLLLVPANFLCAGRASMLRRGMFD